MRQSSVKFHPLIFCALIFLVAAGALALRLPRLSERPLHVDEAVQAFKTGELLDSGVYRYDANEYHGPSLYYLTLPFIWASRAKDFAATSEVTYRLVPVAFGVGLVLLLLLVGDGLGRGAALAAAVLTALSPAMVFYSRYYIQEMLLVFFTFVAIGAGWRYIRTRRLVWAILAGVGLGLMHATKETCVIAWFAMAVALGLTLGWARWRDRAPASLRAGLNVPHLAGGALAGLLFSSLFFSSFLTHPRGVLDSLLAYVHYLHRSDGAGVHLHPWFYYLQMLTYWRMGRGPRWSEGLIVGLALVGGLYALARRRKPGEAAGGLNLVRFLTFYTALMTAIYSLIPYKTPWNMLGFLHGMILLAGVGAAVIVGAARTAPVRMALCLLLVLGAWNLGWQAWRSAYRLNTSQRNPYVYAHTSSDTVEMMKRVEELARLDARGRALPIRIISPDSDYWPLPWYLRRFPHVGYWRDLSEPGDAPIIIGSLSLQGELDQRLRDKYHTEFFGLRPDVLMLAYIREDLWAGFIKERSGERAGAGGAPQATPVQAKPRPPLEGEAVTPGLTPGR